MKSYLISALASRFAGVELESFTGVHGHDWLLWEPGAWRPPKATTLIVAPTTDALPSKGGEALALALVPKKGKTQIALGRGEDCDITINDGTLSQLHLIFMGGGGKWTVRDAGSKNGSSVNGAKLEPGKPFTLREGAQISAAQVRFTYYTPAGMLDRLRSP